MSVTLLCNVLTRTVRPSLSFGIVLFAMVQGGGVQKVL